MGQKKTKSSSISERQQEVVAGLKKLGTDIYNQLDKGVSVPPALAGRLGISSRGHHHGRGIPVLQRQLRGEPPDLHHEGRGELHLFAHEPRLLHIPETHPGQRLLARPTHDGGFRVHARRAPEIRRAALRGTARADSHLIEPFEDPHFSSGIRLRIGQARDGDGRSSGGHALQPLG